jgi:hypothetical protein
MTAELYVKEKNAWFPDELEIKSIEDAEKLHRAFIDFRTHLFITYGYNTQPHYRGEQNYGWDIRSGLFRPPLAALSSDEGKALESEGVAEFERVIKEQVGENVVRSIFNHMTFGRSWDLLFQAQHAGIRTSLTDWSADILAPLFFATEESSVEGIEINDAQLWWLMDPPYLMHGHSDGPESFYEQNPFELENSMLINPASFMDNIKDRIFEYRMFKQKGRFFIPSKFQSNVPLNMQEELIPYLYRIRIPASCKKSIREELNERGLNREYLYVDERPERQELIRQINAKIFG